MGCSVTEGDSNTGDLTPSALRAPPPNTTLKSWLMFGPGRWYTGVRRDGIHLGLLRMLSTQVNLGDLLFEEKDLEDTLERGGTQSHKRLAKGFPHRKALAVKLDSAIDIGFAQNVTGFIFNEREMSGEEV